MLKKYFSLICTFLLIFSLLAPSFVLAESTSNAKAPKQVQPTNNINFQQKDELAYNPYKGIAVTFEGFDKNSFDPGNFSVYGGYNYLAHISYSYNEQANEFFIPYNNIFSYQTYYVVYEDTDQKQIYVQSFKGRDVHELKIQRSKLKALNLQFGRFLSENKNSNHNYDVIYNAGHADITFRDVANGWNVYFDKDIEIAWEGFDTNNVYYSYTEKASKFSLTIEPSWKTIQASNIITGANFYVQGYFPTTLKIYGKYKQDWDHVVLNKNSTSLALDVERFLNYSGSEKLPSWRLDSVYADENSVGLWLSHPFLYTREDVEITVEIYNASNQKIETVTSNYGYAYFNNELLPGQYTLKIVGISEDVQNFPIANEIYAFEVVEYPAYTSIPYEFALEGFEVYEDLVLGAGETNNEDSLYSASLSIKNLTTGMNTASYQLSEDKKYLELVYGDIVEPTDNMKLELIVNMNNGKVLTITYYLSGEQLKNTQKLVIPNNLQPVLFDLPNVIEDEWTILVGNDDLAVYRKLASSEFSGNSKIFVPADEYDVQLLAFTGDTATYYPMESVQISPTNWTVPIDLPTFNTVHLTNEGKSLKIEEFSMFDNKYRININYTKETVSKLRVPATNFTERSFGVIKETLYETPTFYGVKLNDRTFNESSIFDLDLIANNITAAATPSVFYDGNHVIDLELNMQSSNAKITDIQLTRLSLGYEEMHLIDLQPAGSTGTIRYLNSEQSPMYSYTTTVEIKNSKNEVIVADNFDFYDIDEDLTFILEQALPVGTYTISFDIPTSASTSKKVTASFTVDQEANAKPVQTVEVNEEHVQNQLANSVVTVNAPALTAAEDVAVELSGAAVSALASNKKPLKIVAGGVEILLPLAVINDANAKSMKVKAGISTGNSPGTTMTAKSSKYSFELYVDNQEVSTFKAPVELAFPVTNVRNAAKAGAYYINYDTLKYEYVISKVEGGKVHVKALHFSDFIALEGNKTFTDTTNHWGKTTIEGLASLEIISGMTNTTFAPEATITRAQFAALITRALGLQKPAYSAKFKDVPNGQWFTADVLAAANAGIIAGYEDGTFKPNANVTREQMASMVVRALNYVNPDVTKNLGAGLTFEDSSLIASYAKDSVRIATSLKIISGYEANGTRTFKPRNNATRAEAAIMLSKMLENL